MWYLGKDARSKTLPKGIYEARRSKATLHTLREIVSNAPKAPCPSFTLDSVSRRASDLVATNEARESGNFGCRSYVLGDSIAASGHSMQARWGRCLVVGGGAGR